MANEARHPLEAYADSYAQMSRDGDGRVSCHSVEVDIRQNMIPATVAATLSSDAIAGGEEVSWNDTATAPKDGTMLRLLVQHSDAENERWTPFEDSLEPYSTIGFNALSATGEDEWQFAGWDWSHDCFTDGAGTVIGWMPYLSPRTTELEALRKELAEKSGSWVLQRCVDAEAQRDALIEAGLKCCDGTPNPELPRFELALSFIDSTNTARKAADVVWQEYKKRAYAAETRVAKLEKAEDQALEFIDRVSGTALGIAMSGRGHPNPGGVLTAISQEGMGLAASLRAARRVREGGKAE